jgi:PGF-pre-PGF domain-containing protein
VNSSSEGDTIIVCPGTYTVDALTVNKSLKIYGYREGLAVLDLAFLKNIDINSDNVEVKNLTIVTSSPGNAKAFQIKGKNITIENVTIGDRFQHGFYIDASENVTIRGAHVYEADEAAFEIHDSSNITVEDSWILQESYLVTSKAKGFALYNVSSSTFRNNRIYGVRESLIDYEQGYAFYINSSSTGNNFTGNFIRRVDSCFTFGDASSDNLFYNNYFDCALPCSDEQGGYNYYNISKTPGTNIVGGNYTQGNYWGGMVPYMGSDTIGNDGIGDTELPYNASKDTNGDSIPDLFLIANGGDYGPLIKQRETSPPVIFSINLQPNYELSACTLLNASVTSYEQKITSCTLHIGGQALAMNLSQGSYISYCTYQLCPADFPQGYTAYYIEAGDEANNSAASDVRGLNINAAPAVIHIISPANNTAYNTTNISLEVTSDKEIILWNYSLNGAGNVTFTPNTTIIAQNGSNFLEVYALDAAGYLVYANVSFTVDLIPPAIQVISPVNGTLYTSPNVTINATANESVTWRISLNGNITQNVTLPLSISADEGVNHLIIYATDIAGNTNSSEVYFTVDTTPPYAVPSTGNTKVDINSSYNLSWTLYDNVAGGYYRVLRNGSLEKGWQPWSNASDVTVPVNTSQLGTYNYTIEFNDSAGWMSSNEVIITVVDPYPPNITIISPINNTYYNSTTILVNATSDRAVHTWLYSINGSTNNSFIPPENITITSGDGYYLLEIWANSTAGNLSHAQVYFYVDTQPPITTDDSPEGWQNAEFVVNLIAQDNLSGVAYTSYKLDNQIWVNGTTVNITTEGNHTIEYYSVDNAGNVEDLRKTYAALDVTPPVVNITSPLNRTYTAKEIPLNVTANEGISAWTYSLNDASNATFTPNSTTITAQEGINHIVVYALDRAGNLAYDEVYFTVDTTPPGDVGNLTATPGVRSILLNWTNPEDVDFAGVEVWVNGEFNATLNFTFTSFNIEGLLPATTYNISLRTFDAAGNRGNWSNITVTTLVEEKQTPPAGGGGGGETNKNRIEKMIKEANKGRYTFIMIEKQDIEEIAVKPKVDLYYAKITIEFLDELPEYIEKPPADKIYLAFKADFSTKAIEKAKIKFKVKKGWLKENDINPNKVKLLHYHAAKWEESPAKKIGGDDEHYIYEAEVETFSYFVVTGEEGYVEENAEGVELKKERKFDDFPMFGFPMGSNTQGAEKSGSAADVENKSEVYVEINEKTTATEQEESEVQVPDKNTKGICGPGVIVLISLIPLLIFSRKKAA